MKSNLGKTDHVEYQMKYIIFWEKKTPTQKKALQDLKVNVEEK